LLPDDVLVGPSHPPAPVDVGSIPVGAAVLDVGPKTSERFANAVATAKTVLFSGPLGAVEQPAFAAGTNRLIEALSPGSGFQFVLGNDSAAALRQAGEGALAGERHVSHGGRATRDLLEGKRLPGIEALRQAKRA
jgi:phosphoglycerate kinase